MKKIVAIIRPEKLSTVQDALAAENVVLMTISDVRGCGAQSGRAEVFRGQEYSDRLLPKIKIEIAVNDAFVARTIDAIAQAARSGETGEIGDGKIFVEPLFDCIRIRTGERGPGAIGPDE